MKSKRLVCIKSNLKRQNGDNYFDSLISTVNEFFENEKKPYEIVPHELCLITTLPEKIKYFHKILKAARKRVPCQCESQQQNQPTTIAATRKRPNTSNLSETIELDSTEQHSTLQTNESDALNCSRLPAKRRRIDIESFDPELIYGEAHEIANSQKDGDSNFETPLKIIYASQDPTTSKTLQMSASKSIEIGNDLGTLIAKGFGEKNITVDQKLPD